MLGYSAAAVVVYFSVNPAYPLKHAIAQIPFSDPIIHLCGFALVTFCFCLSTRHQLLQLSMSSGLIALALILETLQSILFGTAFGFGDSVANVAGVVVGYWAAYRTSRVGNRSSRTRHAG